MFWASIIVPESVTSIGGNAFDPGERTLKDIYIMNPECTIGQTGSSGQETTLGYVNYTTIHGYAGSTAQEYAEKYSRPFEVIE